MASRQAFLKREPWAARPRPAPASRPPTRRPPKSDPRSPQWRPAPKIPKPTPNKPLFPGMPKPKNPVFGKRPPHIPLPATWAGRLRPVRPFLRLHPAMAIPFLAWDAYDMYQLLKRQYQLTGYRRDPYYDCDKAWRGFYMLSIFNRPCGSFVSVPSARWDPAASTPFRLYEWWTRDSPSFAIGRKLSWVRDHKLGPVTYTPPREDFVLPPDPLEMPYPYPFAPMPIPLTRPPTRPNQEPGYQPQPRPQPRPDPRPRPLNRPIGAGFSPIAPVPSINWSPGKLPLADIHERRPPESDEREKKKRLKPGTAVAWLQFMNQAVGSYTEMDDTISALYKGLPWHLRRWRGRDGVWRDRDIRSDTRAKRLFELLGQLDVEKAIEEVIKQQLTDAAFGTVGNKLKQKAKDLGNEGLWSGATGFQSGGAKRHETWEEAYEKLKKEGMPKVKRRQYTVKERIGPGLYRYVTRTRPVTQIPWYKQESLYPRMARPGMAEWWTLTYAEKMARKKNVKAYYYGKSQTPRP